MCLICQAGQYSVNPGIGAMLHVMANNNSLRQASPSRETKQLIPTPRGRLAPLDLVFRHCIMSVSTDDDLSLLGPWG